MFSWPNRLEEIPDLHLLGWRREEVNQGSLLDLGSVLQELDNKVHDHGLEAG